MSHLHVDQIVQHEHSSISKAKAFGALPACLDEGIQKSN